MLLLNLNLMFLKLNLIIINFLNKKMFKIDQVKNLFDCEQDNQLLLDPVTLPCGYSVCKIHLDRLWGESPKASYTFLCQ